MKLSFAVNNKSAGVFYTDGFAPTVIDIMCSDLFLRVIDCINISASVAKDITT